MYQPKVPVKTAAEVKAILGKDFPSQVGKILDHIDAHCRACAMGAAAPRPFRRRR